MWAALRKSLGDVSHSRRCHFPVNVLQTLAGHILQGESIREWRFQSWRSLWQSKDTVAAPNLWATPRGLSLINGGFRPLSGLFLCHSWVPGDSGPCFMCLPWMSSLPLEHREYFPLIWQILSQFSLIHSTNIYWEPTLCKTLFWVLESQELEKDRPWPLPCRAQMPMEERKRQIRVAGNFLHWGVYFAQLASGNMAEIKSRAHRFHRKRIPTRPGKTSLY